MNKKHILIAAVICLLAVVIIAAKPAGITHLTSLWVGDATDTADVTPGDNDVFISGTLEVDGAVRIDGTLTEPTGGVTATEIADVVRYYQLPLGSWVVANTSSAALDLSATSVPGLEIDDNMPAAVWADGEQTPLCVTFRVPGDYSSGAAFLVVATESDSTTPNQIDFDVYVNADGTTTDASVTGQTPVALDQNTSTPSEVTLTVATDFASLAAGNWVTLRIWRDDTATGTGDLEVKGIVFYYTATQ